MAIPFQTPVSSSIQPFVVAERWLWMDCDADGYEGFRAEVRMNLTNAERERLMILLKEVEAARQVIAENAEAALNPLRERQKEPNADFITLGNEIATLLEQVTADHEANNYRIREVIAPYIRAWNAALPDGEGGHVDALPPSVAGVDAFAAVDQVMEGWLIKGCLEAYRGGKGLTNSPTKHGESGQRGNAPKGEKPGAKRRNSRPSPVN